MATETKSEAAPAPAAAAPPATPTAIDKAAAAAELSIILSSTDAVMESDILIKLRQYIMAGGAPPAAIKMLSEGFRGKAGIINVLRGWLQYVDQPVTETDTYILNHFRRLATDRFSPERADGIFATKDLPEWLEFILHDPGWRDVLFLLSEKYPTCLMLSFAIKKMGGDVPAHVAAGSSLMGMDTDFDTFYKSFATVFTQMVERCSKPVEFDKHLTEFKRICCGTQYGYLFAQRVLATLLLPTTGGSSASGASASRVPSSFTSHRAQLLFKRLSQELSAHAMVHHGSKIGHMNLLLSGAHKYPAVLAALGSIMRQEAVTPLDVGKLYQAYSNNSGEPPPITFLQSPMLLELMVKTLFDFNHEVDSQHLDKYLFILAYAASVRDSRGMGAAASSSSSSSSHSFGATVDKMELQTTIDALRAVQEVCSNKAFGLRATKTCQTLKHYLHIPIIASAVIYWIRLSLMDTAYYETSYHTMVTPMFLTLLCDITSMHALQRPHVFQLLSSTFHFSMPLDAMAVIEARKQLLLAMIHLIHCGHIIPVLSMIRAAVIDMDQALIRFFIVQLLHSLAPPFSREFVTEIMTLISLPRASTALNNIHLSAAMDAANKKRKRADDIGVRGETALKEFAQAVLNHRKELLTDTTHIALLQRFADLATT